MAKLLLEKRGTWEAIHARAGKWRFAYLTRNGCSRGECGAYTVLVSSGKDTRRCGANRIDKLAVT